MNENTNEYDLRNCIRDAIVRRGMSEVEAAHLIGMSAPAMRQVLDGAASVSAKAFNAMVDKWGVRSNRPELQRWLIALVHERLGAEGLRWWKLAKWDPDALQPVPDDPGRELYAQLGDTRERSLRRLAILRVIVGTSGGAKSPDLCRAAMETRTVTDNDVRALVQRGLISSTVVKMPLAHVQLGGARQVSRTAPVRLWRPTEAGSAMAAQMATLLDIRGAAGGGSGGSPAASVSAEAPRCPSPA